MRPFSFRLVVAGADSGLVTPAEFFPSKPSLTLPLFVAGVFADHAHDIAAFDDATRFAKPLDGCSYFHGVNDRPRARQKIALENLQSDQRSATFAGR
jgi:hypothetical protein